MANITIPGPDNVSTADVQRMIDGVATSFVRVPQSARFPGGALIWNGSQWTTSNGGQSIPSGTQFSATGSNGDMFVYQGAGFSWAFKYNAASSSLYKWEFVGGGFMTNEVDAGIAVTSTTYANGSPTLGPLLTLPLAGDYLLMYGARMYNDTGSQAYLMSPNMAGVAPSDADAVAQQNPASAAVMPTAVHRNRQKLSLAANTQIVMQYRVTGGTGTFAFRYLNVVPIRVAGI